MRELNNFWIFLVFNLNLSFYLLVIICIKIFGYDLLLQRMEIFNLSTVIFFVFNFIVNHK